MTHDLATIEQGSTEWKAARAGKLTASRMADALAKTKTGWGASRATLMGTLIAERLTGMPTEGFTNDAMRWGNEKEPEARGAYEFACGVDVAQVGFVEHPTIAMSGASPDGHVNHDGMVEIKCPNTATHIETLLGQAIPAKYATQMMWQMACTGRRWCDFVSYDPRMPGDMQLFIARLERDDKRIAEMEKDARDFLVELDAKVEALTKRFRVAA